MLKFASCSKAGCFSTYSHLYNNNIPKALGKNQLYKKKINRFVKDKGISRQLEHLGIDRMDVALHPDHISSETDVESLRDESKQFRKQFKADANPERVKQIMIQKKMFKFTKKPNLLTCAEKETMRYLHQKDPHEWTVERLVESFPTDKYQVKEVLKSKGPRSQEVMHKLDNQVAENWKQLSKGNLEIDLTFEKHLKQFQRIPVILSEEEENDILENIRRGYAATTPKLLVEPGEFTRIYDNYARKIGNHASSPLLEQEQTDLGEIKDLFGENSLPGSPAVGESSPYGETSLLNTSLNLSKEKSVDIEGFRDMYLNQNKPTQKETKTLKPFSDEKPGIKNAQELYEAWYRTQEDKRRLVSKQIQHVNVDEIVSAEAAVEPLGPASKWSKKEEDVEVYQDVNQRTGQDEIFVFAEDKGSSSISVSSSPDFIKIPENLKHKFNFFQVNDSVYDADGEFLYRVPGLQK